MNLIAQSAKTILHLVIGKWRIFNNGGKIGRCSYFNRNTLFEEYAIVENHSKIIDCFIGKGTDIGSNSKFTGCKIGRYCVIGDQCENIYGHHPISRYVAMNSKFYSPRKNSFTNQWLYTERYKYADRENEYYNIIGNDVYMTNRVIILEGVKIGDGAVITPGSVVTKNVPPYAIVRGNPASVQAYRFKADEIEFLLKLKWWNKDDEWIKKHIRYFSDIKELKKIVELENESNYGAV